MIAADVVSLRERTMGQVSGGERMRILLARALAVDADMLLADEPIAALDPLHQLQVMELLRATAHRGRGVVVVLHDLALASAHADRVLVLDGGQQVELGEPLDVLTPGTIREIFAVEAAIDSHPVTQRPRFSFHLNCNA